MPLVLGPLLVGLLPFLAALVLLGLSQASTSARGSGTSGDFWDFISGRTFLHQVGGFASSFARWIVSRFAAGQLVMLARWFHNIGTLTIGWFTGSALFSEAITAALERVEHRGDPKARTKAAKAAGAAAAAAATAHKGLRLGHSNAADLHHYQTKTDAKIKPLQHATTVTLPHDIAGLRARNRALADRQAKQGGAIKALEDGAGDTWDWIRTHPLSSVTGLFAGAVVIALSRLGYGFLRCRSWRNVGKRMNCGIGSSLLNLLDGGLGNLLGVFLTVEATVHFRDLVKVGQEVEHGVAEGIKELLNVVE